MDAGADPGVEASFCANGVGLVPGSVATYFAAVLRLPELGSDSGRDVGALPALRSIRERNGRGRVKASHLPCVRSRVVFTNRSMVVFFTPVSSQAGVARGELTMS